MEYENQHESNVAGRKNRNSIIYITQHPKKMLVGNIVHNQTKIKSEYGLKINKKMEYAQILRH